MFALLRFPVVLVALLLSVPAAGAAEVREIARGPLLGDVQLDGDAVGNAVLAWSQLRGEDWAVYAADVRDGRPGRRMLLGRQRPNLILADLDVSPGGTAAACLIDQTDRSDNGLRQVRVRVRRPGAGWGTAIVVGPRRPGAVSELQCAVADDGAVLLSWWAKGSRAVYAAVDPAGVPSPIRTIAADGGFPAVGMSAAGEGTVLVTDEDRGLRNRRTVAVQRSPDGTLNGPLLVSPPGVYTALPELAVGGDGTRAAGWIGGEDGLDLVTGDLTAPVRERLAIGPGQAFTSLVSGPAGGLLATWDPRAATGGGRQMRAALRPPGATAFGAAVSLPNATLLPVASALAADGTGHIAYRRGPERRPLLVTRPVGPGGWGAERRPLGRRGWAEPSGIAAAPGGHAVLALTRDGGNRPNRLLLARLDP